MNPSAVRVLIADDQAKIRHAFRLILEAQPDIRVVAEAADGVSAVEQARHLRPDVVLADIRMPRLDGLEVTRLLTAESIPVVVVTTFDLDEYVHTALRNGACGFLLKRSGPALLVEGVRAAVAGDALISPQITVRLLRQFITPGRSASGGLAEPLTAREKDVVGLIARGMTNGEIAARLFLTAGTVKNHVARIQRKLDVQNRVGIAAWAWETGHADRHSP